MHPFDDTIAALRKEPEFIDAVDALTPVWNLHRPDAERMATLVMTTYLAGKIAGGNNAKSN